MEISEDELIEALLQMSYPDVYASEFNDVLSFFDYVESYFDKWYKSLINSFGLDSELEFEDSVKDIDDIYVYTNDTTESMKHLFLQNYIDDAQETFPEAYEYSKDNHIKCVVCGKIMRYCSDDSVMLNDDKWMTVLKYYDLVEYEREAHERNLKWIEMCRRRGNLRLDEPEDCNTFICNDCIEKALGHPITLDDINDSPFNYSYIHSHFVSDEQKYTDVNTNAIVNESYFNDKEEQDVDVNDCIHISRKCFHPNLRVVLLLNTEIPYLNQEIIKKIMGDDEVEKSIEKYEYVRDIPLKAMKIISNFFDNSLSVYSYGNFRFISSGMILHNNMFEYFNIDVSDNSDFITYNDEGFKWYSRSSDLTQHSPINKKIIVFDIQANFFPKEAYQMISFFSKFYSEEKEKCIFKSLTVFLINEIQGSYMFFPSKDPAQWYNMMGCLCDENVQIGKMLMMNYKHFTFIKYIRIIIGSENINHNDFKLEKNIDITEYNRVLFWKIERGGSIVIGSFSRDLSDISYNPNETSEISDIIKLLNSDKSNKGYVTNILGTKYCILYNGIKPLTGIALKSV